MILKSARNDSKIKKRSVNLFHVLSRIFLMGNTEFQQQVNDTYTKQQYSKQKSREDMPIPTNIYLFQINHKNTRKNCETCLNLLIKTLERSD